MKFENKGKSESVEISLPANQPGLKVEIVRGAQVEKRKELQVPEVKVGQVWRHKSGTEGKVVVVDTDLAFLERDVRLYLAPDGSGRPHYPENWTLVKDVPASAVCTCGAENYPGWPCRPECARNAAPATKPEKREGGCACWRAGCPDRLDYHGIGRCGLWSDQVEGLPCEYGPGSTAKAEIPITADFTWEQLNRAVKSEVSDCCGYCGVNSAYCQYLNHVPYWQPAAKAECIHDWKRTGSYGGYQKCARCGVVIPYVHSDPCTTLRASLPKSGDFISSPTVNPLEANMVAALRAKSDLRRKAGTLCTWPVCPVSKVALEVRAEMREECRNPLGAHKMGPALTERHRETLRTWTARFACPHCEQEKVK